MRGESIAGLSARGGTTYPRVAPANLVGAVGIEPTTYGVKARYSAQRELRPVV